MVIFLRIGSRPARLGPSRAGKRTRRSAVAREATALSDRENPPYPKSEVVDLQSAA